MKKHILTLLSCCTIFVSAIALPATVGAVNIFQACNPYDGSNNGASAQNTDVCGSAKSNTNSDPIITVLKDALEIISFIAGFAAVTMIIIGGFKFVMANGDSSAIKSARETILYAAVGIIVVMFSQVIVAFVLNRIK